MKKINISFLEKDPSNSFEQIPNSLEIKEIKQMLISGNKEQILHSVEKIKSLIINNKESLVELIKSDVSEFLCDALISFDDYTIVAVYDCLRYIVKNEEFFNHCHSCFIVESLIRSIHILVKNSGKIDILSHCLDLLILIIKGYQIYTIHPEKMTVLNLLQLLPVLLKKHIDDGSKKYQMGKLIWHIIDLDISPWEKEIYETILKCASFWFDLIINTPKDVTDDFIPLGCMICSSILRLLINSSAEILNVDIKNDLITHISIFLVQYPAFYFSNISSGDIEKNSYHLEYFIQALVYFYNNEIADHKSFLSHGLSEMRYLQFMTNIISFADTRSTQKLRQLCLLVLFNIILTLSEDLFLYSEIWPNDRQDFCKEIQEGISQLPLDASQWLDILISPTSSKQCKLSLLLYLYYYSMTANSQVILRTIHPAIVTFINSSSELNSSALYVKIIWFIFVMSHLSGGSKEVMQNETEAIGKIIFVLEEQKDFSLVYTHHPAILYWAFSSGVKTTIQIKVVRLWLENKTSDCKELEELIVKSPDVRFAILDVLLNGSGQTLESAFSSMKSALIKTEDENLASSIWFVLPQLLAKYTADSLLASTTNVDYVIELSALKTPKSLDITKVIRISTLLPEVLIKSDLISIIPSLSLTLELLQIGFQLDDYRVMNSFLRFDGFLQKIIEGMEMNMPEITITSFKIITLLWNKYEKFIKPQVEIEKLIKFGKNRKRLDRNLTDSKKVKLKQYTILKILENGKIEVFMAGLEFLQEIIRNNFRSPIFQIQTDSNFIETLFFEVENLCMKNIPGTLLICWKCLELFLKLDNVELANHLATNPFLHELIVFHLPNLKKSLEMQEFLRIWFQLNHSRLNDCCFDRKIFGGFFNDTIKYLVKISDKDFQHKDKIFWDMILESDMHAQKEKMEIWKQT